MITQTHPNYDQSISLGKKWLIERNPCGFTCTSCAVHISQCNRCNSCADCTKTMESAPFPAYIHGSMVGYQWCTCDLGENPNNLKADTQDDNSPTYISHSNKGFISDDFGQVSNEKSVMETSNNIGNNELRVRLEDFLELKGVHKERKVSNASRKFYEKQDKLIEGYEEVQRENSEDKQQRSKELRDKTTLYAKISFVANVILLAAKLTAAVLSGSMAIISSLVDSVVDITSGLVIWVTTKAIQRTDPYKYPNGRHLLEPLAVIILSVIMGMASLQLLKEAVCKIVYLYTMTMLPPTVNYLTISISGFTIVLKFVLCLLCRRVKTPTVQALAQDHRNDVLSNTLAIVCGYVGSREIQEEIGKRYLIYADPAGAIFISLYIAITWYITGRDQTKLLTGKKAEPAITSKLLWISMNHHADILSVNHVVAYHVGYDITAELDICVASDLPNYKAQEVKETLKSKLENVENINRVYINVISNCEKFCSKL
ncbi:uncharacterized protein LOC111138064 [Crassostrea virginica]